MIYLAAVKVHTSDASPRVRFDRRVVVDKPDASAVHAPELFEAGHYVRRFFAGEIQEDSVQVVVEKIVGRLDIAAAHEIHFAAALFALGAQHFLGLRQGMRPVVHDEDSGHAVEIPPTLFLGHGFPPVQIGKPFFDCPYPTMKVARV